MISNDDTNSADTERQPSRELTRETPEKPAPPPVMINGSDAHVALDDADGEDLQAHIDGLEPPHVAAASINVKKEHAPLAMRLYQDAKDDVDGAVDRLMAFVHKLFAHV